ncbi:hypothetical protein BDR07DRAFT_1493265 [Suillus spraguei]|nr:hypothetical protein BDR07DRAFT_1493265 [Suillus spraguei]
MIIDHFTVTVNSEFKERCPTALAEKKVHILCRDPGNGKMTVTWSGISSMECMKCVYVLPCFPHHSPQHSRISRSRPQQHDDALKTEARYEENSSFSSSSCTTYRLTTSRSSYHYNSSDMKPILMAVSSCSATRYQRSFCAGLQRNAAAGAPGSEDFLIRDEDYLMNLLQQASIYNSNDKQW